MKTRENIVNAASLQSLEGNNLPLKTKDHLVNFNGKEERKSRNKKLFQSNSLGESLKVIWGEDNIYQACFVPVQCSSVWWLWW